VKDKPVSIKSKLVPVKRKVIQQKIKQYQKKNSVGRKFSLTEDSFAFINVSVSITKDNTDTARKQCKMNWVTYLSMGSSFYLAIPQLRISEN
jgi:hypothetical protein